MGTERPIRINRKTDAYLRHLTSGIEQQSRSLLRKRQKLLDAHYADAIPLDLLKQEQDQIAAQLASIEQQRAALSLESHVVQTHLGYVLDLLEDCFSLYMQATPSLKKLLNGVFLLRLRLTRRMMRAG